MSSNIQLTLSSLIPAFRSNLESLHIVRDRLQNLAIQLGYVEVIAPTTAKEDSAGPTNLIEAYDDVGRETNDTIRSIEDYIVFIENATGSAYHPNSGEEHL